MRQRVWRMQKNATNYKELYIQLARFMSMMITLPSDTPKCKVWVEAFKGAGAYYTLMNLTMFHGCNIIDKPKKRFYRDVEKPAVIYYAGVEATKFVKSKLDEYKGEGWRYLAMLRKCIADNNFDFKARMAEIYSQK